MFKDIEASAGQIGVLLAAFSWIGVGVGRFPSPGGLILLAFGAVSMTALVWTKAFGGRLKFPMILGGCCWIVAGGGLNVGWISVPGLLLIGAGVLVIGWCLSVCRKEKGHE